MWQVFLTLSIMIVVASFFCLSKNKKVKLSSANVLFAAVFIANTLIFIPINYTIFSQGTFFPSILKTILISMHHAIRLFVVDSDFDLVKDMVPSDGLYLYNIYTSYAAMLFVLSPAMTFGFILSYFKNVSAYRRYIFSYNKDLYVFSEVNERSIALASSLNEKYDNIAVIFAGFGEESNEINILRNKKNEVIALKKDVLTLNFKFHSKKENINFFMISEDEEKNINEALEIIGKYNQRKNTQIYVLSSEPEGELLLNAARPRQIKVKRINNAMLMIYNILQFKGERLFQDAVPNIFSEKNILAVVIGLGKYGREMTKSLVWFCQMEGYRLEIDTFDIDQSSEDCLICSCPELLDNEHNGKFDDPGEAQYKITFHSQIDVESIAFDNEIRKLKDVTYVFISLGNDEKNIRVSVRMRMLFEQLGIKPRIHAVVEAADRKKMLEGMTNYSGEAYEIEYVGAIDEVYSYNNIINSELEKEALTRHLRWGEESEFWKYEYNYRSSMASALHKRMKEACGIPGINKTPAERTEEEKRTLRLLEHRRWNAYMRSQGYVYSDVRNNLAKTHNCLISFDLLSQKDKEKDDD